MTDKSIPLYSLLNQCECFLFSRKGAGMKLFEAVKEAVTARSAPARMSFVIFIVMLF